MAKRSALDRELDRLYGSPPGEFVVGRDALAKELKARGQADDAAVVKKLRRPSPAASLVNWLSLERASDLEKFATTVASMRDQATAADGRKLRATVKAERGLVKGLLADAEAELQRRGGVGSSQTLDRVGETLRAIATDPELERSVLAGRLEKEGEASTIGFELAVTADSGSATGKARKDEGPDLDAERATLDGLRRHLEAAEERAEEVAARLERAEQRLAAAHDALGSAKDDVKAARAEVRKQERLVKKLEAG